MKRRISTEIIDSIVRSTISGTTATKIMFNAYLSYDQFKAYLQVCIAMGFISREADLYKITPDGAKFLKSVDEVRMMIGEPEKTGFAYPSLRGPKVSQPLAPLPPSA